MTNRSREELFAEYIGAIRDYEYLAREYRDEMRDVEYHPRQHAMEEEIHEALTECVKAFDELMDSRPSRVIPCISMVET